MILRRKSTTNYYNTLSGPDFKNFNNRKKSNQIERTPGFLSPQNTKNLFLNMNKENRWQE